MRIQRFTKFDDAKKAAKSLPGSIVRRDGDSGWIITVPDSVVEPKATSADPVASRLCELCRKPIPAARIEAVPNVTKCIECQSTDERREDPDDDDLGSCHRCGCSLVWRQGAPAGSTTKYFIGCSDFPKCRYSSSR